jgi:hypothetical protein
MGAPAISAIHANTASIEAAIESAKSNLFDTSSWREFCDVTLTLKQATGPTAAVGLRSITIDAGKLFGIS